MFGFKGKRQQATGNRQQKNVLTIVATDIKGMVKSSWSLVRMIIGLKERGERRSPLSSCMIIILANDSYKLGTLGGVREPLERSYLPTVFDHTP
jgi:hypothetical protein